MKISIGADHRGYLLKKFILAAGFEAIEWVDVGCFNPERCAYSKFANLVVENILQEKSERGILICSTGQGMAIAANRHKGIYAALCWNEETASLSRNNNNSNLLVLPAKFVSSHLAQKIVLKWLNEQFDSAKYQERIDMFDL